jgi:cyanophycin synthetase
MISLLGQPSKELDIKKLLNYGGQYLILKEAQKKGINCQVLIQKQANKRNIYICLKKGKESHWLSHQKGFFNSKISCNLALSKYLTYQVLESAKLPTPRFTKINRLKQIEQIKIPRPWVIKPANQTKGRDVFLKIKNIQELKKIARHLLKKYRYLMIEEFVKGNDYRLLVLDNKLIGAVKRIPAQIKGDGVHNIRQLIEISNTKERRIKAKKLSPFLKRIKIDLAMKKYLAQKNLKLSSIPKKDKIIRVRQNANFSTGGETEDVTNLIHTENIKIAHKTIKALGLKLCGIDIITKDISQPIEKNKGKIIEINGIPSLWIHHFPNHGQGRNAAGQIIDYLFKN